MRKYLLPLLVFGAIGALVVIGVLANRDDGTRDLPPDRDSSARGKTQPEKSEPGSVLRRGGRDTPTSLNQNRWLSELERALERDVLPQEAYNYRGKLCENIGDVLGDEKLTNNLLAAIRKYAVKERDPAKRKLLLPILRVLTTPEATRIIEEEFYRTSDPEERLILLDGMANPKHNPETASVWAVEMAVHAEDPEHRHLAFEFMANIDWHHDLVVDFAKQVYDLSTRTEQQLTAIGVIAERAPESDEARTFIRARLAKPRESELMGLMQTIPGWGTERDAALLESLIGEFPAFSDQLRTTVEEIRTFLRQAEERKKEEAREREKKN